MTVRQLFRAPLLVSILVALTSSAAMADPETSSQPVFAASTQKSDVPHPRHEAGFINLNGRMYLIGGRGVKPVDIYNPETKSWTSGATPPVEMHHFQPVIVGDEIWIVGAMTGPWPGETPLDKIWRYIPERDEFLPGADIPLERRRSGGGAVNYGGRIWWTGGIVNGHRSGTVAWLDSFGVDDASWRTHPDAPSPRDHFQAAIAENRLYAIGGRVTDHDSGKDFELTIAQGDVFDIGLNRWLPADSAFTIPTPRAGAMTAAIGGRIVTAGGESGAQLAAHHEVEAYDPTTRRWSRWESLALGRHGSGFGFNDGDYFIASGSGKRGGEPELADVEQHGIPIAAPEVTQIDHAVTLDFTGPQTAEAATLNPFTSYRLTVIFEHEDRSIAPVAVRGFYAADGDAADSGAASGSIWRAHFSPTETGQWSWTARLARGTDIATNPDFAAGETVPLPHRMGTLQATKSDKAVPDFRASERGKLAAKDGRLIFERSGDVWLKSGTNSPENLLAFNGIDGTYRMGRNSRHGEADSGAELHKFAAHVKDWRNGDPLWGGGHGRGLIGAANYLADSGVNAVYFLTWNVGGDGKDVWPFVDPGEPMRFDVSKLAQWDRIFAHMQARGIALHIVLQETENELVMDSGDTGRIRKLYMAEMIARFGHHNALFWNLGEENGPVHWRPEGQNDAQRRAMIDYLTATDPYNHPILLHTHSEPADKDALITPLLGYDGLDGLSLQVSNPLDVARETLRWKEAARQAGRPWVLTMDEIGPWQDGAIPDAASPDRHARLRQDVLWPHLLGGGSGVEWYFGAKHAHNDLTAEDFRSRDDLWRQSRIARELIAATFDLKSTAPCTPQLTEQPCMTGLAKSSDRRMALIYLKAGKALAQVNKSSAASISYADPLTGLAVEAPSPQKDRVVIITMTN